MKQPVPEAPTNVQHSNPYNDISRGLFVIRNPESSIKLARVHAATWVTKGPAAGIGHLQFQLMGYTAQPTTAEEYANGVLLDAPDGTKWFDCLTRGLVTKPIMAEYWAINIFYAHYINVDAEKLSQEEIDNANTQAAVFTATMGKPYDLKAIDFQVSFQAVGGQPISRISMALGIDYELNGAAEHMDIGDFPTVDFDPVRFAGLTIRNQRE
jgi:hypothetical protein